MKYLKFMKSIILIGLAATLIFSGTGLSRASSGGQPEANAHNHMPVGNAPEASQAYIGMNLNLHLPQGSRIDYLRIFYYDTSANNDSYSWLTVYDGQGSITDLTEVSSIGNTGYGTNLSPFIGHIVDNLANSYVLNWRPNELGKTMQLCGFRVAYRLPDGSGGWLPFLYSFSAGTTLTPRDSAQLWGYAGVGCTYAKALSFMPLARR